MKCRIVGCKEKAKYNYINNHNPAYCYTHSTSDMENKIKNIIIDTIDFISYGIEKIIPKIN
jgi:hypothetical protein